MGRGNRRWTQMNADGEGIEQKGAKGWEGDSPRPKSGPLPFNLVGAHPPSISPQPYPATSTSANKSFCCEWLPMAENRMDEEGPGVVTYEGPMGRHETLFQHILLRRSDANVPFDGLCALLKRLGFDERIRGDHHIFTTHGVE